MLPPVAAQQEPSLEFTETDRGTPNGLRHASMTVSAGAGRARRQERIGIKTSPTRAFIPDIHGHTRHRRANCGRLVPAPSPATTQPCVASCSSPGRSSARSPDRIHQLTRRLQPLDPPRNAARPEEAEQLIVSSDPCPTPLESRTLPKSATLAKHLNLELPLPADGGGSSRRVCPTPIGNRTPFSSTST